MASELLLETLEDLRKDDFEKFKWFLSKNILDGYKPIPRSHLENASHIDTVSRMTERYCEESAVSVCIVILKKMRMNYQAEMLEEEYAGAVDTVDQTAGGKTAATSKSPSSSSSSSSSASAPPPAPASISAVDGGVVVAPTVSGCTVGSLNITINKT